MGTGYTRNDTANNIADGNVINAADFDGEFDAIESAFNSSSGHTHDGTSSEGAPIEVVGPTQDVVITASALRPKTDNTVDLGTSSLMYKDGFFDGTVTVHSLVVLDDEGTDATIKLDGNYPDGSANVAMGLTALDSLDGSSPGGNNIAIGNAALTALTTGSHNIAIGSSAGDALTTGGKNIAIGFEALSTEDGNGESTAIGYQALKTQNAGASGLNVAVGYLAGTAVSTGVKNTLLGAEAGDAINSGGSNVAVGYNALTATTTSSSNTAVGADALKTNVTGASNVAVGNTALEVATGSNNTAIGKDAGNLITSGAANTIIGQFDGNQGTLQTLDIRTSSNHIVLSDGAGEPRIVVENNGRVLVGNTSAIQVGNGQHVFQVGNTDANIFSTLRYSNSSGGSRITLGHTRSASVGTVGTAVVDNDVLGQIDFAGDDGSDVVTIGARIKAEVDGTPSSNNMPSALTFSTFEASGSLTERMRITDTGEVGINSATPVAALHIADIGTTGPAVFIAGGSGTEGDITFPHDENADIGHWNTSSNTFTSRIHIDTSGNVGLGTNSPSVPLDIQHDTDNTGINVSLFSTTQGAGSTLRLAHSLNDTIGTQTAVTVNDTLGKILFSGSTGSSFYDGAAIIADATQNYTGSNAGTRLEFYTTSNSTQTLSERMLIDHDGNVGIGTSTPSSLVSGGDGPILSIGGTDTALGVGEKTGTISFITSDASYTGTYSDGIAAEIAALSETSVGGGYGLAFYTGVTTSSDRGERVRITDTGDVGIGTSTPSTKLHIADTSNDTRITLESTSDNASDGPVLDLYRNSANPDDNDNIGIIQFNGENDAGEKITYARMDSFIEDASDGTEDARLTFSLQSAGSSTQLLGLRTDTGGSRGQVVVNEGTVDIDFKVEGDTTTNLFYVDASEDRVGIGTSTPASSLHVSSGTAGDAVITIEADTDNNDEDDTPSVKFLQDGGATTASIGLVGSSGAPFTNSDSNNLFLHAEGSQGIDFATGTELRMRVDQNGKVGIGNTSNAVDELLHIEQNTSGDAATIKVQNGHASSGADAILQLQTVGNNFSIQTFPDADTGNANRTSFKSTAGSSFFTFDPDGQTGILTINGANIGFGTTDPDSFVPTNVSGGRDVVNVGSGGGTYIAARNDSTISAGNVIGAYLIRSNDSSGVKFGGMRGKADDSSGNFHLELYAGNSTTDTSGALGAFQISDANDTFVPKGGVNVGKDADGTYNSTEEQVAVFYDNSSTFVRINVRAPSSGGDDVFKFQDGTLRAEIEANGDFLSASNSYGSTSDERLKENIELSGSQWDDVKALQIKKYSMKEDNLDAPNMLGVIAQDLQASGMNGLVKSHTLIDAEDNPILDNDGNEQNFLSVKYSILYMKAVKALQEAMTKIESLETENTAIKARLDALET